MNEQNIDAHKKIEPNRGRSTIKQHRKGEYVDTSVATAKIKAILLKDEVLRAFHLRFVDIHSKLFDYKMRPPVFGPCYFTVTGICRSFFTITYGA